MRLIIKDDIELITTAELNNMLWQLPQWRREKALAFRFEGGKRECACAFLLLQNALPQVPDIEFIENEHGKPFIRNHPEIHFNMSHCKHAVCCAISNNPIGVDIECRGRYKEDLARYTCSEKELSDITEADDADLAFTILWTKKESLLKLIGTGITDDIKNILYQYTNVEFHTEIHTNYVCSTAQFACTNKS